jgi:arylsulfatase A-like enzyme
LGALVDATAPGAAKPNIPFIVSDDDAQRAIPANGSKMNKTPHLDRPAKELTRRANSFVANFICTPGCSSMLTRQ